MKVCLEGDVGSPVNGGKQRFLPGSAHHLFPDDGAKEKGEATIGSLVM